MTPLPLRPAGSSMRNGLFGMPALWACVSATGWPPATRPPHVGGSTGRTLPSKSFCGTTSPTALGFTPGMPFAPGNSPYRLSKARFSA